jgi:hypothetical protein
MRHRDLVLCDREWRHRACLFSLDLRLLGVIDEIEMDGEQEGDCNATR